MTTTPTPTEPIDWGDPPDMYFEISKYTAQCRAAAQTLVDSLRGGRPAPMAMRLDGVTRLGVRLAIRAGALTHDRDTDRIRLAPTKPTPALTDSRVFAADLKSAGVRFVPIEQLEHVMAMAALTARREQLARVLAALDGGDVVAVALALRVEAADIEDKTRAAAAAMP